MKNPNTISGHTKGGNTVRNSDQLAVSSYQLSVISVAMLKYQY